MQKTPSLIQVVLLFVLLWNPFAFAQLFRAGVTGGLPLTDAFDATTNPNPPVFQYNAPAYQSASQRAVPYTIGPSAELRLMPRLSIEVDALYRRAIYNYTRVFLFSPSSGSVLQQSKHSVNIWEFPVFVKYRLAERHGTRPFFGIGISEQYNIDRVAGSLSGQANPVGRPFYSLGTQDGLMDESVSTGGVAVAGLELGSRRMRISPQFRFSRWFHSAIDVGGPFVPGRVLRSQRNEFSVLVSVTF